MSSRSVRPKEFSLFAVELLGPSVVLVGRAVSAVAVAVSAAAAPSAVAPPPVATNHIDTMSE